MLIEQKEFIRKKV